MACVLSSVSLRKFSLLRLTVVGNKRSVASFHVNVLVLGSLRLEFVFFLLARDDFVCEVNDRCDQRNPEDDNEGSGQAHFPDLETLAALLQAHLALQLSSRARPRTAVVAR